MYVNITNSENELDEFKTGNSAGPNAMMSFRYNYIIRKTQGNFWRKVRKI